MKPDRGSSITRGKANGGDLAASLRVSASSIKLEETAENPVPETELGEFVAARYREVQLQLVKKHPYLAASEVARSSWSVLMALWSEEEKKKCRPSSNGSLSVDVIRAKQLIGADSNGLSDPYVQIQLGSNKDGKRSTKTVSKSLNPQFNQQFRFPVEADADTDGAYVLTVSVFDKDLIGRDDFQSRTP